ncbi:hypothetical protein F4810DRAFT_714012 [Camillea tinctor]|nr:hypothetical protein F4810DRAFT_714012 [Camillea tinctor]
MDFINKLSGDSKEEEERKRLEEAEKAKANGGFMDKLSSMVGGKESEKEEEKSSGGFLDKINAAAGGGKESEKNEDALDKGVDWVQKHVLGQGDQSNESAIEQAKDEQISDYIRGQYKKTTGTDFPIKDKDRS